VGAKKWRFARSLLVRRDLEQLSTRYQDLTLNEPKKKPIG
jgi:hypothetical protein